MPDIVPQKESVSQTFKKTDEKKISNSDKKCENFVLINLDRLESKFFRPTIIVNCPKNNLNLRRITEPITVGADETVHCLVSGPNMCKQKTGSAALAVTQAQYPL